MLPYLTSLGQPLPLEREQLFFSARRPIGQGVRVEGQEAGGPGSRHLRVLASRHPAPLLLPTSPPHLPVAHIMLGDHCSLPEDQALPSQSPQTGLCCKMVLQAVSKVLRKSKAKPNGKKPAAEERKAYLEPEHTKARITDFQFKELVVLPREIDLNEWLASNTTTFFHHINLQYSTISEFCTGETCQTMAVCNTQYYWYDERGKKVKCTAPQYVDFVMSSVQKLVTDEDVFPTKYENSPAPLSPW
ncbi:MOB kinase activator 2 isoform X3 [Nomascus leucogenys]|uniref:MOB kinase activator 2 isoform X3 n=1 Tax=Nomascus leucogenys TaxID=61853 RepID=UPI00122D55FD|nr:MOB kinase activator 2 isoform X3 [Nomascus leucogenys]